MSLGAMDKEIIEALAAEDMGAYIDAVYNPPDGGAAVPDVYVVIEDLVSETTGEVTQGGAVLSLLRSQLGQAVQGATLAVDGTTWKIGRRRSSTDPSMLEYEAYRT